MLTITMTITDIVKSAIIKKMECINENTTFDHQLLTFTKVNQCQLHFVISCFKIFHFITVLTLMHFNYKEMALFPSLAYLEYLFDKFWD